MPKELNCFRPLARGAFFNAYLGKPLPRAPAEQFVAGIRHGMHRAHSSGIKVPISSVARSFGGDENFNLQIRFYLFLVLFVVLSPLRVSITVL